MEENSSFARAQRKMVAARIEFLAALARIQPADLSVTPTEEEWSPLQIVYHLSITDGLALEQMRRIQEEDNPHITNIAEIASHILTASANLPSLVSILATMQAQREAIFRYLSDLPETAWERPFQQEQWGQCNFHQFVNLLPLQDKMATRQLGTLR